MLTELLEKNLNSITKDNVIIYVDMDGVLADFDKGVEQAIGISNAISKYTDKEAKKATWKYINGYGKEGGKFWYELDLMSGAEKLMSYVRPYHHEILTASGHEVHGVKEQKIAWIKKHFGDVKVNIVENSREKAQFACSTCILIDDMHRSIDPWIAAGGIGILYKGVDDSIGQLKNLGL